MEIPAPPAGLVLRGIRKRFGARTVLDGVDLTVAPGQIHALLGPNGAGKSTLFKILIGLLRADAGSASVGGRNVFSVPLHRKRTIGLGYLPQDARSFPELTASENLLGALELLRIPRSQRRNRLEELLARFALDPVGEVRYEQLSGGEQRRVEIAQAVAASPEFLLLDEPFSGLDPRVSAEIRDLLAALARQGLGVLLTDHTARFVLSFADRVSLLDSGRIQCSGPPEEVEGDNRLWERYLGRKEHP